MALDDIIKEHTAWLDEATRRPIFQRVTAADTGFPQELRDRRAKELAASIDALGRRRAETDARYAAAIASYKAELEALLAPLTGGPNTGLPPGQPGTPPGPRSPGTGTTGTAPTDKPATAARAKAPGKKAK